MSTIKVHSFVFSPFSENTYVLYDDSKDCVIIDPGCYDRSEKNALVQFIEDEGLKPVRLILTHGHLDHVCGNAFVTEKYGLKAEMHKLDLPTIKMAPISASLYGIPGFEDPPEIEIFIEEGDVITFGNASLEVLFTPGHAPGHIVLVAREQKFVIGGDVLFQMSIGRTDLPGGHHDTLIKSIREKLFPLGDDFTVYSGHGPETNIGFEKANNPFLR